MDTRSPRPEPMLSRLTAEWAARGWDPAALGAFRMEAATAPVIPDDLAALSDDELAALIEAAEVYARAVADAGADVDDDTLAALEAIADGTERARTEQTERATAATERAERLASITSRIAPAADETGGEGGDEGGTGEAEGGTAEGVAAGGTPAPATPAPAAPARAAARPLAPLSQAAPVAIPDAIPARARAAAPSAPSTPPPVRPTSTIVAAAGVPGMSSGDALPGLTEVADALIRRREAMGQGPLDASSENVTVATIRPNMPEDRTLRRGQENANAEKILAVTSPAALAAAGGVCVAAEPYFDLLVLAGAARPVRDSKAVFVADRQGVSIMPPPRMSQLSQVSRTVVDGATTSGSPTVTSATAAFDGRDVGAGISGAGIPAGAIIIAVGSATSVTISANATATATGVSVTITRQGAVGVITQAQDAAALNGTLAQIVAATKPVIHVDCPAPFTALTNAVTAQLEFGNWTSRAYPEQVVAWQQLLLAVQARRADTLLLDAMSAKSTQLAVTAVLGAARDLVAQVVKGAAYFRNVNRMDRDAVLRWEGPAWVLDLAVCDLVRGSGYDPDFYRLARDLFVEGLAQANVRVSFYVDSGTGKGQLLNGGVPLTNGQPLVFPSTVVWYLYAEGSWLFLDGGELNLGVVRDSALNNLNNYRLFSESFEGLAFVGVESLEVTSTLAATGTYAGPGYGSSTVAAPVAIPTAF